MGTGIHCKRHRGVSKSLTDNLGLRTTKKCKTGEGVTKFVEADFLQPSSFYYPREVMAHTPAKFSITKEDILLHKHMLYL